MGAHRINCQRGRGELLGCCPSWLTIHKLGSWSWEALSLASSTEASLGRQATTAADVNAMHVHAMSTPCMSSANSAHSDGASAPPTRANDVETPSPTPRTCVGNACNRRAKATGKLGKKWTGHAAVQVRSNKLTRKQIDNIERDPLC